EISIDHDFATGPLPGRHAPRPLTFRVLSSARFSPGSVRRRFSPGAWRRGPTTPKSIDPWRLRSTTPKRAAPLAVARTNAVSAAGKEVEWSEPLGPGRPSAAAAVRRLTRPDSTSQAECRLPQLQAARSRTTYRGRCAFRQE